MAGDTITVTVKLFGGLHEQAGVTCMEAMKGFEIVLPRKARVSAVLKQLKLKRMAGILCIVDGEKAGFSMLLHDNAVVAVCRLIAGG
jgi:hypothetical protein